MGNVSKQTAYSQEKDGLSSWSGSADAKTRLSVNSSADADQQKEATHYAGWYRGVRGTGFKKVTNKMPAPQIQLARFQPCADDHAYVLPARGSAAARKVEHMEEGERYLLLLASILFCFTGLNFSIQADSQRLSCTTRQLLTLMHGHFSKLPDRTSGELITEGCIYFYFLRFVRQIGGFSNCLVIFFSFFLSLPLALCGRLLILQRAKKRLVLRNRDQKKVAAGPIRRARKARPTLSRSRKSSLTDSCFSLTSESMWSTAAWRKPLRMIIARTNENLGCRKTRPSRWKMSRSNSRTISSSSIR